MVTIGDVFVGVKAVWDGAAALATAFPGGVHQGHPLEPQFRYAIFRSVDNHMASRTTHTEIWMSIFDFYSFSDVSLEHAGEGATAIATAFNPATISISGGSMLCLKEVDAEPSSMESAPDVYQAAKRYECRWQRPRTDTA